MPYLTIYFPTLCQWIQAVPNLQVLNKKKYLLTSAAKNQTNTQLHKPQSSLGKRKKGKNRCEKNP